MKVSACARCISLHQRLAAEERALSDVLQEGNKTPASIGQLTGIRLAIKQLTETLGNHKIAAH